MKKQFVMKRMQEYGYTQINKCNGQYINIVLNAKIGTEIFYLEIFANGKVKFYFIDYDGIKNNLMQENLSSVESMILNDLLDAFYA